MVHWQCQSQYANVDTSGCAYDACGQLVLACYAAS